MNSFEKTLLRLKAQLGIQTDKGIAEMLGLSQKAFISRKMRGSFPEDKLLALIAKQPDLNIDVDYVLTGKPSPLMTRAEAKRLGVLTSGTKDILDKFIAEDDGDESRDDEPFNINTPATYRLSQEEWKLIQRFRCASFEERFSIMQAAMAVDMSNKTIDDYKPEPTTATKSAQHFHGSVTGDQFAAGDITNHINKGKKRK